MAKKNKKIEEIVPEKEEILGFEAPVDGVEELFEPVVEEPEITMAAPEPEVKVEVPVEKPARTVADLNASEYKLYLRTGRIPQ